MRRLGEPAACSAAQNSEEWELGGTELTRVLRPEGFSPLGDWNRIPSGGRSRGAWLTLLEKQPPGTSQGND